MADMELVKAAGYIAAGFCMGFGTLGPSLGQGFVGGKGCESIGKKPEHSTIITRTMLLGLAFIESAAIYAFIVSLMLIYK